MKPNEYDGSCLVWVLSNDPSRFAEECQKWQLASSQCCIDFLIFCTWCQFIMSMTATQRRELRAWQRDPGTTKAKHPTSSHAGLLQSRRQPLSMACNLPIKDYFAFTISSHVPQVLFAMEAEWFEWLLTLEAPPSSGWLWKNGSLLPEAKTCPCRRGSHLSFCATWRPSVAASEPHGLLDRKMSPWPQANSYLFEWGSSIAFQCVTAFVNSYWWVLNGFLNSIGLDFLRQEKEMQEIFYAWRPLGS